MSAGPLVVEIICTCLLAAYVLHRYGDLRKQHILVTMATFIAWYFSFMIIFIIPLDVSSTFYRQCLYDSTPRSMPTPAYLENNTSTPTLGPVTTSTLPSTTESLASAELPRGAGRGGSNGTECEMPLSYVPDNVLPTLWRVVYWTSQILTWLVLPLMQSYSNAGDFTVAGKIKSALIENAIYYGTYLLIFGICLIYVAARADLHIDAEKLKVIGVTASNTWGLFVLVLMLGYGLVEVPRNIWNNTKPGYLLSRTYFKLAKLSTERTEAEEALEDVLDEIKRTADCMRYTHPLRPHMDTILQKCPESLRSSVKRNIDDYEDYEKPVDTLTAKGLVRLHKRVIRTSQIYRRTQVQWNMLVERAVEMEDVAANENSSERYFRASQPQPSTPLSRLLRQIYTPTIEWYWRCRARRWVMMLLAVVLMVFSFMVVWSECLFFVKSPVLSLFAVFINLAKQNYDYVYIELASILTIAYLCFCAYYSVFQIRIFNYYYIAPHHQTNEYSLIFTGMMLARLTPPMCLNFLGLIHLDSHVTSVLNLQETAYTQIMGHMDVISIISDGFNIYFPILIVLLCICTYFSLGSRLLSFLGFQQFIGDDDMTQELIDEGREMIRREKRRQERKAEGETRRRMWTERFGEGSPARSIQPAPSGPAERREIPLEEDVVGIGKVARSPDDNDRTELLREVEALDYTEERGGGGDLYSDQPDPLRGGYQARPPSRYTARPPPPRHPPRGIFDDI